MTLHRDVLVRYRLHPQSASGPSSIRWLIHDVWTVKLLSRHRRRCRPEERRLIDARCRGLIPKIARSLYYYGRERDLALARKQLRQLFRAAPCGVTCAYLSAAYAPPTVDRIPGRLVRVVLPALLSPS